MIPVCPPKSSPVGCGSYLDAWPSGIKYPVLYTFRGHAAWSSSKKYIDIPQKIVSKKIIIKIGIVWHPITDLIIENRAQRFSPKYTATFKYALSMTKQEPEHSLLILDYCWFHFISSQQQQSQKYWIWPGVGGRTRNPILNCLWIPFLFRVPESCWYRCCHWCIWQCHASELQQSDSILEAFCWSLWLSRQCYQASTNWLFSMRVSARPVLQTQLRLLNNLLIDMLNVVLNIICRHCKLLFGHKKHSDISVPAIRRHRVC